MFETKPAPREPTDSIGRFIPEALWKVRTAAGQPLDAIHVLAWRWLADRADRHGRVEFCAAHLAERFNRRSHVSALSWIEALESAQIVSDVESQRGSAGFTRLRMRRVEEVAARGELATCQADPQLELGLEFVDEAEPTQTVPFASPSGERAADSKCHDTAQYPDICPTENALRQDVADAILPERPDVPRALWQALQVHLGARNAEVYLGPCRFELATSADARHRIVFPSEYLRDYLRTRYRRQLAMAFADAGLHLGDVELPVDPSLAAATAVKCRDAAQYPDISAQQPTLVRSSSRASNQPTNQPDAARDKPGVAAPTHPVLVAAHELYQRIGDPTLWKWVAIAAVLLQLDGDVTPAEIDGLIASSGDDFGSALKKLARARGKWPTQGRLKSRLRASGVHWKRAWEHGLAPAKPKPR